MRKRFCVSKYPPDNDPADEPGLPDDFANFDPSKYVNRRGNPPGDSTPPDPTPDEFANFDPDKYLRSRRAELGHPQYGEEAANLSAKRGRRRWGEDDLTVDRDEGINPIGAMGLGRELLQTRERREDNRLWTEIIRGNQWLLRPLLIGAGCLLILVALGLCSLIVTIYNALAHR